MQLATTEDSHSSRLRTPGKSFPRSHTFAFVTKQLLGTNIWKWKVKEVDLYSAYRQYNLYWR